MLNNLRYFWNGAVSTKVALGAVVAALFIGGAIQAFNC